ncbi:MAG: hypothetical protein AAFX06_21470, partial [Planctomycetota bacterium]
MKWKWSGLAVCALTIANVCGSLAVCRGQEAETESVTISAAKAPVPALHYRFWPSVREGKTVSAMPMFTRACFMMEESPETSKELNEVYELLGKGDWSPELKARAEAILANRESVQDELERATDCMEIHFDLNIRDKDLMERISLLLPEVQKSRSLARLLIVRAHTEARAGDWDAFSRTVTTLFRVAEMAGHDNAFLVGRLVRYAIVSVTLDLIESTSQFEDCPNFYWALASVPQGLFDVERALEWERENPLIIFGIDPLPNEPIGAAAAATQLRKTIDTLRNIGSISGSGSSNNFDLGSAQMFGGLYVAGAAAGCREMLKNDATWADRVDELSDAEAVLRANQTECRRLVDEFFSWALLPTSIRDPYLAAAESKLEEPMMGSPVLPAKWTVQLLLPALRAVYRAEHRMQNRFVEAINLQAIRAAVVENSLPADVDQLPLPAWPGFGDRPDNWYKRLTNSVAEWKRVDEKKPGQFKNVKV